MPFAWGGAGGLTVSRLTFDTDLVVPAGLKITVDHLGETTPAHGIVHDNKALLDHLGETTPAHGIVFDNTAGPVPGTYLGTTIYSSGSGNHTTGANTHKVRVTCIGSGGPGGWGNVAGSACGGGGGGGGAAVKTLTVNPSTAYAYVVGAAGSQGASGSPGTQPSNGTNTTFVVGGTTVLGGAGTHGTGQDAAGYAAGGAGGAASGGDFNFPGTAGEYAGLWGSVKLGGSGGSAGIGGGGVGFDASAAGTAGQAPGGGGAGAIGTNLGGAGTAGLIIVEEFV